MDSNPSSNATDLTQLDGDRFSWVFAKF